MPPMVENVVLAVSVQDGSPRASITWTPTSGAFDLKRYRIQLCASNTCTDIAYTTDSSIDLPIDTIGSVFSFVSAESHCDEIGEAGRSNEIFLEIPSINSGKLIFIV